MLIYLGGGYLKGIPARNLTKEEVKECGGVKKLVDSGLYAKPDKNEAEENADNSEE